jgi:uncharacterized membrane protein
MFFFLPDSDLRVSDADRDAAVDFLNRHYAAGRLTDDELSARIDAAYRARYDSQLHALTDDLPGLSPAGPIAAARSQRPLGTAAAVGAVAVGGVAVASVMPPEVWAMLLGLGLPLLMMLLFTVAPLALPVLAFLWIARALGGSGHVDARRLSRGPGWFGVWELEDRTRQHDGRRPGRVPRART